MIKRVVLGAVVLMLAPIGCGGDSGDSAPTGRSTAAISSPSRMPVPNGWDGTAVELMVADALGACTWTGSEGADVSSPLAWDVADDYIEWIGSRMGVVAGCAGSSSW